MNYASKPLRLVCALDLGEYPRAGDPFALNVLFDPVFIERGA